VEVDVISGSPVNNGPPLAAGVISNVDWVGTFGSELPGIKEAAEGVFEAYRGKTVAHRHVINVMGFNTQQIKAEDVPSTLEELTDPKWRGKFVLNPQGILPFDILGLQLGPDGVEALLRQLLANGPLLKGGGMPAVTAAVATGEVPVGPVSIENAHSQKAQGAPVEWKPFAKYTPVLPSELYVPNRAPHPNVGRLFVAWLVTEGMKIQEARDGIGRVTDPNSAASQVIAKATGGAPVLMPRNAEELKVLDETRARVVRIFTEVSPT
jgi:iron(III) transport system substrate-binding protein